MIVPEDFFLPFGGSLNKENRWVKLAQIIPWRKVEEHYAAAFKKATAKGTQPFSARLELGVLIIQQRQGFSDRETVLEITENPYMQYFLGLPVFQERPPFHYSMMSRFRKRLKKWDIEQINEWLVLQDQPAAKEQLDFLKQDLKTIHKLATQTSLAPLASALYRDLLVVHELYRQQDWMYRHHENRIDDRIVSLSQPHVRPVRGKARARVEFGAKVAISLVNGDAMIEALNWDNFNEGTTTLQTSVETYRYRFGFYPEAVLADTLYRNRDNLNYCKLHHIRLSGPRLGRKPKAIQAQKEDRRTDQRDFKGRIPIEGKFGEGKRRYGLNRIRTMLREISETVIALKFLIMNMERRLRASLRFFAQFKNIRSLFYGIITILKTRLLGTQNVY